MTLYYDGIHIESVLTNEQDVHQELPKIYMHYPSCKVYTCS